MTVLVPLLRKFVKWLSQTKIVGAVMWLVRRRRRKLLMRALHSEHGYSRAYAMQVFSNTGYTRGEYGDPRILVDIFIQSLSAPDAWVRECAARALCYSLPVAIPGLTKALSDTVPAVRIEALIALGSLRAEEAIEAMASCLHEDPDMEVRAHAVAALDAFDESRVAGHLSRALDDTNELVRSSAADSLSLVYGRARFRRACASDETQAVCDQLTQAVCDQLAVPALCKALGDADADTRLRAAEALQGVLDCPNPDWDAALEPLCAAALDPQASVRGAVIKTLGLACDPRAHALITQALDDASEVKAQAVESLARIDPSLCLKQVARLLADPDISLQRAAVKAMRWMSACPLPAELLSYYADAHSNAFVREEISDLIAQRRDPAYVPALLNALSTEDDFFRHSVIKALAVIPDQRALPALMVCLQHEDPVTRGEAALALAELGDEQAITALDKLIDDDAPSVRWRAIWALSFFDIATVQAMLARGLVDHDEHVRSVAIEALAGVCDAPKLKQVLSSLPRTAQAARAELEEAIVVQERNWRGSPSSEVRSVHRGTLHYE